MKILITGATGIVGRRLIPILLQKNIEVIALFSKNVIDQKIRGIKSDITDKNSLNRAKKLIGNIDTIIHLAAYVPTSSSSDLLMPAIKVNTLGTANLLEVFGDKANHFIYASSVEIYGRQLKKGKISETVKPYPLTYYADSKLSGENLCLTFGVKNQVKISVLRFSVMYGYYDPIERAIPNFIKACLEGKSPTVFGGDELRDYLHVEDAANAIYQAIINKKTGVFNIGSGRGIKISEVANIIRDKINPSLQVITKVRNKPSNNLVLNISAAKKELQYKPKYIFPEKLEEMIKCYQKN